MRRSKSARGLPAYPDRIPAAAAPLPRFFQNIRCVGLHFSEGAVRRSPLGRHGSKAVRLRLQACVGRDATIHEGRFFFRRRAAMREILIDLWNGLVQQPWSLRAVIGALLGAFLFVVVPPLIGKKEVAA